MHIATEEPSREMRAATWKQFSSSGAFPTITHIVHSDHVIYTAPAYRDKLLEAQKILEESKAKYKVVDVTDKEQISDRDLAYICSNQGWFFRDSRQNNGQMFGRKKFGGNIYAFRRALETGLAEADFPYVMFDGRLDARSDNTWGWMIGADNSKIDWKSHQKKNFGAL